MLNSSSNINNMSTSDCIELYPHNYSKIDNIFEDFPEKTTFIFNDGTYVLTKPLVFVRNDILFMGKTGNAEKVNIIQTEKDKNAIEIYNDNVCIKNLTVTIESGNGFLYLSKECFMDHY